jgi:hypothetical protein
MESMNKIIQTFQAIQLYWFRTLKRYKDQIRQVNICEAIKSAKTILFCMPNDDYFLNSAQQLINLFVTRHPDWKITIVGRSAVAPQPGGSGKREVITFSDADMTFYGKPSDAVIRRVAGCKYDLAIDLSIPYDFTNLVLIWNANAALRVGFHDLKREPFFGFLFRQHQDTLPDKAYQALLKHLEDLM